MYQSIDRHCFVILFFSFLFLERAGHVLGSSNHDCFGCIGSNLWLLETFFSGTGWEGGGEGAAD